MKLDELRETLREDQQTCACCKRTAAELRERFLRDRCGPCRVTCLPNDDGTYVHFVERNRIEVIVECPKCDERKRFAIARDHAGTVKMYCKRCDFTSEHDVARVRVPHHDDVPGAYR